MELFKKAAQAKLRFKANGLITAEDLYDLPLTSANRASLDSVAKSVNKELKLSEEESFVSAPTSKGSLNQLRLDILKEVIADKLEANEKARTASAKKDQRQKLLGVLADKQDQSLGNLTEEELKAQIAALDD